MRPEINRASAGVQAPKSLDLWKSRLPLFTARPSIKITLENVLSLENGIESGCRYGRQGWSCGRKSIVLVLAYKPQEPRPLEVPPVAVHGTAFNQDHP